MGAGGFDKGAYRQVNECWASLSDRQLGRLCCVARAYWRTLAPHHLRAYSLSMGRRRAPQFILLVVAYTLLCSPPIGAQLPRKLKRCLPYPTLADEIREMKEEVEAKTLHPRVIIDAVKFEGTIHLPDSIREQLVASLEQREFDADSDWVGELQEVGIRETWLRQGYWRAQVRVEAQHISGDSTRQHVLVTVRVDEGPPYQLGDI